MRDEKKFRFAHSRDCCDFLEISMNNDAAIAWARRECKNSDTFSYNKSISRQSRADYEKRINKTSALDTRIRHDKK